MNNFIDLIIKEILSVLAVKKTNILELVKEAIEFDKRAQNNIFEYFSKKEVIDFEKTNWQE